MNAPSDVWAELMQDREPLHFQPMTDDEVQAMADEYQREAIETARSERHEQESMK